MMKKITLNISIFLTFCFMAASLNAQTIFYEDFRYDTGANGFTVQQVALDGQAPGEVGKIVSDVVDATNSNPLFDPNSRTTYTMPNGTLRDQRAISFNNMSGNPASINHEIEAWAFMTNQNLSAVNAPKVSFWTQQQSALGGGSSLTIWVSQNYTHGNLPSTATWTNETANITGNIATSDVADQTYVKGELDLSAYTGSSVTVAFKIVSDGAAYVSATSQHGTFYISDVKFDVTQEDVASGVFSALNTSSSGQTNIFDTPSASVDENNFTNTGTWANVLTTNSDVPILAQSLIPVEEGYKFKVADNYKPIRVSQVRYVLAGGTVAQGAIGQSAWVVQASNNNSTWDNISAVTPIYPVNSGNETPLAITENTPAYRYYRFVLAQDWTPNSGITALQKLDFTVFGSPLSINDNALSEGITIYPNPTNSIFNIKNSNANMATKKVSLISVMGKTVYSNTSLQPINVSRFSKGLYILKIEAQDGSVATKKVLVN